MAARLILALAVAMLSWRVPPAARTSRRPFPQGRVTGRRARSGRRSPRRAGTLCAPSGRRTWYSGSAGPVPAAGGRHVTRTPRALYQVILPKAPQEGFIVVYEFADPTSAAEAATAQAAYLATGPAKVQSPFGARTSSGWSARPW